MILSGTLFRINIKELMVEVAAHTRCINAIDIHAHQPLVVTVGEDTFVNVWSLPDFESKGSSEVRVAAFGEGHKCPSGAQTRSLQVSLLFSSCVKDQMLTGVQFLRDGTSNVACAAYDTETISVYARS